MESGGKRPAPEGSGPPPTKKKKKKKSADIVESSDEDEPSFEDVPKPEGYATQTVPDMLEGDDQDIRVQFDQEIVNYHKKKEKKVKEYQIERFDFLPDYSELFRSAFDNNFLIQNKKIISRADLGNQFTMEYYKQTHPEWQPILTRLANDPNVMMAYVRKLVHLMKKLQIDAYCLHKERDNHYKVLGMQRHPQDYGHCKRDVCLAVDILVDDYNTIGRIVR